MDTTQIIRSAGYPKQSSDIGDDSLKRLVVAGIDAAGERVRNAPHHCLAAVGIETKTRGGSPQEDSNMCSLACLTLHDA